MVGAAGEVGALTGLGEALLPWGRKTISPGFGSISPGTHPASPAANEVPLISSLIKCS